MAESLMKIVIIGDTSVGKTCLIMRYTHDTFRENFLSTIGLDFKTKQLQVGSRCYKLQIWDTAGQERYNTIRKNFYRRAKGVVIVYDIASIDSFMSVSRWVNDVDSNVDSHSTRKPALLLLANKSDLSDERMVDSSLGNEAAEHFGAMFAEVSARTGSGVQESFDGLVKLMCEKEMVQQPVQSEHMTTVTLGNGLQHAHSSPSSCCSTN